MNKQVDELLNEAEKWPNELKRLRSILLDCGLQEEYKWRSPCYSYQGNNVAILGEFKEYCGLSFFKGVLLKDTEGILVAPGENSQSSRLVKFTSTEQIDNLESVLRAYIFEAVEVEKAGLKVDFKKSKEFEIPEELESKFAEMPDFKTAFYALTTGRQRGYVLHFSAPKQSKTRTTRIEKNIPRILDGYGFHDCTCGHSKRHPTCDGSHKYL